MKIMTLGQSGRLRVAAARIGEQTADTDGELLLLPIPTTRDKIHLTGTDIELSSLVGYVASGGAVLGYGIPPQIANELRDGGVRVLDASLDEGFLCDNAAITADGTVGRLLTLLDRAPRDLTVGIVGYGRIGSRLLSRLLFLGARVVMISAREEVRLTLGESGVDCRAPSAPDRFSGLDVLVNTAPAPLISEDEAAALSADGVLIVDLASGAFLPDTSAVLKLPSVPDLMYPVSAGRILAEYALRCING